MDLPRRARFHAAIAIAAIAALALLASPALAVVIQTPQGRVGYLPLKGEGPPGPSRLNAFGNLDYHGGPVMHSNAEYAIYWDPTGSAFPAGYTAAVTKYLEDVAADSGKPTNVYSVGTQYTDSSGAHAAYGTTFGGAVNDSDAYPASGCPNYGGFSRCLTEAQIVSELNSFLAAHSLPGGLTTYYLLFLPDGVGSCFTSNLNSGCFDRSGGYCAYHDFAGSASNPLLFANQSFAPRDPFGCGTRQYPNGHANGNVDDELSSVSHEANEMITDPVLNAWWNSVTGEENGDQCRLTSDDFGPPLGGSPGSFFNQLINGTGYYLQQEWSNAVTRCEQRYALSGSASGPSSGVVGKPQSFSATASDGEGGTITGISWSFGDGGGAGGPTATHTYTAPGTYRVTAQISNGTGLTATAAAPALTIRRPSNSFSFGHVKLNRKKGTAKLPTRVPNPGSLKLRGKGLARQRRAAGSGGTFTLLVKPKGKVKRTLDKKGKVVVKAKVTYTPNFGLPNTKAKRLKLVKRG